MAQETLIGTRFNYLTVIAAGRRIRTNQYWRCRCECGQEKDYLKFDLTHAKVKSCGCIKRTTHGKSNSLEYQNWENMIQRCTNPNREDYHRYGGRGITVCDWWRKFENFYADMGPRGNRAWSIERRDNDGPYNKDNCYWATMQEQSWNKPTPKH